MSSRRISRLRLVAINLLIFAALLVVFEGLAGYRYFVTRLLAIPRPEATHTRYDSELGWTHIPGAYLPDVYGPGNAVTINAAGYRSLAEFTPEVYLWYKRDGGRLRHQLHLFTFILDDFSRASTTVWNYYKPLLIADGVTLTVTGTPVPGPRSHLLRRFSEELESLRSAAPAQRIGRWLRPNAARRHGSIEDTRAMVRLLLEDLQRVDRDRSSTLVLVPLPNETLREDPNQWLPFLHHEARRLRIPYIDLLDAFEALSPAERRRMFIADGALPVEGAAGHYRADGHALVAGLLADRLKTLLPEE